ncbi:MAG: flagellin [Candidatus Rokubacteria bacterium]|nr:flagellin [Candidatus Rokubacteria bacterium]
MATGDLSRIRTNIGALNALNALEQINAQLTATNFRMATGRRINSAGDDPAGLSLANTLDLRARRVAAANQNVGDAENVMNTTEGGLNNINDLLTSIMEKLVLAANDTMGTAERNAIQQEITQLGEEVDSVLNQTQFNGRTLLQMSTVTFQVGPDGTNVNVFNMTTTLNSVNLGITLVTVGSQALASSSMATVQAGLDQVRNILQKTGSTIERLRVRADNLSTAELNLRASESRIRDADLAAEQLTSSKLTILQQTATASLAGANTAPASILALFQ